MLTSTSTWHFIFVAGDDLTGEVYSIPDALFLSSPPPPLVFLEIAASLLSFWSGNHTNR